MTVLFLLLLAAPDLLQQGAQAMRAGRFAEAERIYRQLVKQSPDDARLRLNLGLALHSGKKYREALPELGRYLQANPQPGPVHLLAGTARLKLGEFCDAIPLLEKARDWRASEDVLVELGDAYSGCQRPLDAARAYQQVSRKKPEEMKYAWAAARAYWQARDYSAARPLYAALEGRLETDPRFLYEYGDTLARLESPDAGLPYLERAVRAEPDLRPARGALGRALMELGRAADALPHLEAAATVDPALLLPLSRAYKATGRAEDAARTEAEYRKRLGNQN
jgi:tetratricopeptide (TPR) repeat protein